MTSFLLFLKTRKYYCYCCSLANKKIKLAPDKESESKSFEAGIKKVFLDTPHLNIFCLSDLYQKKLFPRSH